MRSFMPNHEAVGELGDVDGRPVVLHYGDVEAEYAALRTGTLLVDRSLRGRLRVRGEKAKETVTGLVTNDILALEPGHGVFAAALTPKGRIIADVRVFVDGSALLIDAPARAFPGFLAMLKKYLNPRVAPFEDESATTTDLCVAGANSRLVLAEAFGAPSTTLGTLPPYGHIAVEVDGAAILVARTPEVGVDAFDCFVPAALHDMLRTRLRWCAAKSSRARSSRRHGKEASGRHASFAFPSRRERVRLVFASPRAGIGAARAGHRRHGSRGVASRGTVRQERLVRSRSRPRHTRGGVGR